jgi:DNA repair protein RadC
MGKVIDPNTDKQIHEGRREKLRLTFQRYGLETFNEVQVLEFALGMVIPRLDTNPAAHRLINIFGSLDGVISAHPDKLREVAGMGTAAANFLHFLKQFVGYMLSIERKNEKITNPSDAVRSLQNIMKTYPVEHFIIVCLDKTGTILLHNTVLGDIDKVDINLREVADLVLRLNTYSVVFAHNHLNGKVNPSDADMILTRRLVNILLPLGVNIIDHIIFAGEKNYGFFTSGVLDTFKREYHLQG